MPTLTPWRPILVPTLTPWRPILVNKDFNPDEPRNAEGEWTSYGADVAVGEVKPAQLDKETIESSQRVEQMISEEAIKRFGSEDPDVVKAGVAAAMEKDYFFPASQASIVMEHWATTSNDSDTQSLALQLTAEEVFDLKGTAPWSDTRANAEAARQKDYLRDRNEPFLESSYEATQAMFAEHGITEVTLYRGVEKSEADHGVNTLSMRPLSSWSTDPQIAHKFAVSETDEARVYVARVPVSKILSTAVTGIGCLGEGEAVVLGGRQEVNVMEPDEVFDALWDTPDTGVAHLVWRPVLVKDFNPDEPRNAEGEWTTGDSSSSIQPAQFSKESYESSQVLRSAVLEEVQKRFGTTVPSEVKEGLSHQLAKSTGESAQACSDRVKLWAHSSNDSDPASLAMQISAEKEFGIKDAAGWDNAGWDHRDANAAAVKVEATQGDQNQKFLRAQYDATQSMFADHGIKDVVLYRGVHDSGGETGEADVAMRPLSSWSTSPQTALGFATSRDAGDQPRVYTARVPASQILSTSATGNGCLNEQEVVVLGGRQRLNAMEPEDFQLAMSRATTGTDPNKQMSGQDLSGQDLSDANLEGANLEGANLSDADLTNADLSDADLTNADLESAHLTGAYLTNANLTGANLTDAKLGYAYFKNADLTNANLTDAKLMHANLTDAKLWDANLKDTDLKTADLTNADLENADLTGANLWHAKLTGANLTGADLTGTNLWNAEHDATTKWPAGFTPPS